jgi:hypothetical protein
MHFIDFADFHNMTGSACFWIQFIIVKKAKLTGEIPEFVPVTLIVSRIIYAAFMENRSLAPSTYLSINDLFFLLFLDW